MVPSWIKMRVDLRNHPKVKRMARVLKADRLRVIGGLYAVWSHFDTYSPDGRLEYDSFDTIDEDIGWRGFARAMAEIGWLAETANGVEAPEYGEHNGPTAKRRALETKRKADERSGQTSASNAPRMSASDADTAGARMRTRGRGEGEEEEEKEKDTSHSSGEDKPYVRAPAAVCRALKAAGIPGVSSAHPRLLALLDAGATEQEFIDAAPKGVGKADGFAYVLGVVEGRRRDAAHTRNGIHHGPMPRAESPMQREARERIEAASPGLAARRADAPPPEPMEVVDVVARRLG